MSVRVGDPVDMELIEKSRQAIMDLGLFKSVKADLLEEPEGKILQITVDERFYILPVPLIDARVEGDYSYGAEVSFDNLAGLNQRLKLKYEKKESTDSDVPLRKETLLEYRYPRIIRTPYSLAYSLKLVQENIEALDATETVVLGEYERNSYRTALNLSRWANSDGSSHGWYYGGGINARVDGHNHVSGNTGLYEDTQAIGVMGNIGFDETHEYKYYREGIKYSVNGVVGAPQLGSDYSYNRTVFLLRNYLPLRNNRSNFNVQLQLGLANGCNFGCNAFSLGGGDDLRGYESDYVEGNAAVLANLQYHHQIGGYKQIRGVLFSDIGNAYPGVEEIDLSDLKTSVGIGLRWKVETFVDLTLRVDYAYGIEAETQKAYLTTSTMF